MLFEAINLVIKQGDASDPELCAKAVGHLCKFINIREPNIRYLGLDLMSRMTTLEGTLDVIRKQQATIFFSLKDADISIRRRALDLLFAMCDKSIAEPLVKVCVRVGGKRRAIPPQARRSPPPPSPRRSCCNSSPFPTLRSGTSWC